MPSEGAPFLFLSASTPWVYTLAERLAEDMAVHAVQFYDWRTYWTHEPTWPTDDPNPRIRRTLRVLPTGYAGRLEWLARPFMRWMIDGWRNDLRERGGGEPFVVVPYPYLAPWVRGVPDDRLVYYNLDAYTLYRPGRADRIRRQEGELVKRAARTICLSKYQVQSIQGRHPDRADRIEHFPLGVVEDFINPSPERDPEPGTVGYVGNLGDRVDWGLVDEVVRQCSDLEFLFAGGLNGGETSDGDRWREERAQALDCTNVTHLGRIPQQEVTEVYWRSAVNWIPYDPTHPFNEASCPTKVMDGIASGRPVVSTSVPECTLYPQWITVADEPDELAEILRRKAKRPSSHSPRQQLQFARGHTWEHRAQTLRRLLAVRSETEVHRR
jgi:glycosyltransferase involved in cell wall biosynthesis